MQHGTFAPVFPEPLCAADDLFAVGHQRLEMRMALENGERFCAFGATDIDDALKARPIEISDEAVGGQGFHAIHRLCEQFVEFRLAIQIKYKTPARATVRTARRRYVRPAPIARTTAGSFPASCASAPLRERCFA